jgi:penicillin-binding protein 2
MAEKYLTGTIADTWERRYWRKRLREEVRSSPEKGVDPAPSQPAAPATQVSTQPSDSSRTESPSR